MADNDIVAADHSHILNHFLAVTIVVVCSPGLLHDYGLLGQDVQVRKSASVFDFGLLVHLLFDHLIEVACSRMKLLLVNSGLVALTRLLILRAFLRHVLGAEELRARLRPVSRCSNDNRTTFPFGPLSDTGS